MSERVSVASLRAEVEAAGVTVPELAARLGWRKYGKQATGWDNARVRRLLGAKVSYASRGYGVRVQREVNRKTAVRVREALRG